ncbi:FlxA-like family protein [Serratia rubidaea]|uniref:FlxA-like family protein n=1 Tax=Serratia rubidaea TaxID=61652 RepID=UPI00234B0A95|nr:FlxA-like family protein [Serratia rubidaea]MDC6109880.1 FlxA-like family protein [Serratia rubidaea]
MINSIISPVPLKPALPAVGHLVSAPGKTGQLLMATPLNNHADAGKAKKSDGNQPAAPVEQGASARIKALQQQIEDLQQQLLALKDADGDAKQIEQQKQLIQARIAMLQAEIARIRKEELEKQQAEQMKMADGVNRPTPHNALDVYI